VGDCEHSWAYDGLRGKKWNKVDADYGNVLEDSVVTDNSSSSRKINNMARGPWKAGDVVGCLLSITPSSSLVNITSSSSDINMVARMSFTLNGEYLGDAFDITLDRNDGFYPALSLEDGEAALVNIGQRPFIHHPSGDIGNMPVIISEDINDKTKSSKKGKKPTKKEMAAAKEAETVAVSPSVVIQAPYLPVLQALDKYIRDKIPLESNDFVKPLVKTKEGNKIMEKTNKIETTGVATDVIITEKETVFEAKAYPPVVLEDEKYGDSNSLKALDLGHLKAELERRGLKAGGSLDERANRLFSVRGLKENEISKKIKAVKK